MRGEKASPDATREASRRGPATALATAPRWLRPLALAGSGPSVALGLACAAALAAIATLQLLAAPYATLDILDLAPIGAAVWLANRRTAALVTLLAAVQDAGMVLAGRNQPITFAAQVAMFVAAAVVVRALARRTLELEAGYETEIQLMSGGVQGSTLNTTEDALAKVIAARAGELLSAGDPAALRDSAFYVLEGAAMRLVARTGPAVEEPTPPPAQAVRRARSGREAWIERVPGGRQVELPVPVGGHPYGLVAITIAGSAGVGPRELQLLDRLAAVAGGALEHLAVVAEDRQSVLLTFSRLVSRTISSLDLRATLEALPASAASLLHADLACLYFLEEGSDHLRLLGSHGYTSLGPDDQRLALDAGINAAAATSGRVQRLDDYLRLPREQRARTPIAEKEPIRSFVVAPLIGRARTLGTISAGRRRVEPFTDADVFMLELLGGQASIAIDNALSYRALQNAREDAEGTAGRLQLAVDLAIDVAGSLDPAEVISRALRRLRSALELDWASFILVDAGGGAVLGVSGPSPLAAGHRLSRRDPLLAPALEQRPPYLEHKTGRALASVPLGSPEEPYAVLVASREAGAQFTKTDVMTILQVGTLVVLAHRNAVHYSAEQKATRRAQRLGRRLGTGFEVALDLATAVEIEEVVKQLLVRAVDAVEADRGALATVTGHQVQLTAVHDTAGAGGAGGTGDLAAEWRGLVDRAIEDQTPIQERRSAAEGGPAATELAMPLVLGGEVAGVITVSRHGVEPFDADEIASLQQLGNVAVLAIRNARLLAEAKESGRTQQKFMNMAAHELRTPLAVIRGYLSMLQEGVFGEASERWTEALGVVAGKSQELAQLIEELLLAARLQAGPSSLARGKVDLRDLVRDAVERSRPRASMLGARVSAEVPAEPVVVMADAESIGRVLDNLINNGMTYSDQPSRVRVILRPGDEPAVAVQDTGWGVPDGLRERIFESFFRVDDPDRPFPAGTGLGLAISREIVERHGGRLQLQWSKPGQGSRFRFWLPGVPSPDPEGRSQVVSASRAGD